MNPPANANADAAVSAWQQTLRQSTPWQSRKRGRRRTDKVVIHPAAPDRGVHFVCHGLTQAVGTFPADWGAVVETRGGTVLGNRSGVTLHGAIPLLAALRVVGIDNALVEVHGPRVPADVSDFRHCLELLADAGVQHLPEARRLLRVVDRIEVRDHYGSATLAPAADFHVSVCQSSIRPDASTESGCVRLYSDLANLQPGGIPAAATRQGPDTSAGGVCAAAHPLREISMLPEGLQARMIDLIGHLALAGGLLAGSVHAHESSEAICQALVRTIFERHAVEHTTLVAHRARIGMAELGGTRSR